MTTADRLLEQMFSWIDQRSCCADQLVKLAQELKSLRQKCKGGECVGSSVAVVGAAYEPNWSTGGGLHNTRFGPGLNLLILVTVTGVLAFFTLKSIGTKSKFLFDKGSQQLITKISVTGMKTVLKGGGMVNHQLVGGAIGMAFALNEAIDSWTDLIKNNNVTEASQSLRDTAKAIRKISKALRDQFKDMKNDTLEGVEWDYYPNRCHSPLLSSGRSCHGARARLVLSLGCRLHVSGLLRLKQQV
ncbi:unnamed protein product [Pleuronectes platessa]|uniref:Uncharacterized protein n=1 Tax=Pleuronectes platessa TaxID=8262 RepID=A0A9N7UUF3_PLEPL|nr:unnamed protein product [Pleuronectes platessa]